MQKKRTSSRLQYVTIILITLVFLLILLIIIVVYKKYRQIKGTVKNIKKSFINIIPKMQIPKYKKIRYPKSHFNLRSSLNTTEFDINTCLLLEKYTMSAYNLCSGYDPMLPDYSRLVKSIGHNGYLFSLGDNDYVIAYRGTNSREDILTDINFTQVSLDTNNFTTDYDDNILVHRGFFNLWSSQKEEIQNLKNIFSDKVKNIYVTGHSLGASTAFFTALDLKHMLDSSCNIILYVFAPPRVGNDKFVRALNTYLPNYWTILNKRDVVVNLPPPVISLFGSTYIYDDYNRVYSIDIETGSIVGNHHLTTYIMALNDENAENTKIYWNRKPKIKL